MAISPCDLYKFAQEAKMSPDEAVRRAAMSRGYYCVFHELALALAPMLKGEDVRENGLPSHGAVARALREVAQKHPDHKKAMAHGAEAKNLWNVYTATILARGMADYALEATAQVHEREAVLQLGRVDRLRKFAKKLAA